MEYPPKMDRSYATFGSQEEFDAEDREYWLNATYEEKLMMITYLRECFYGPEATTGKVNGEFRFVKWGDNDDPPTDKTFTMFRKNTMRVFRKAVKKAIKENKAAGIDESELHPPQPKNRSKTISKNQKPVC
jgi:hypothetical protein